MIKKINKKTYFTILLVIFLLLILPFFYFKSFQLSRNFNQNSLAGKVVVISDSYVEIEGVRQEIKRINFDQNISISKGRNPANLDDLATGTFIVAELDTTKKEFPTALRLRILDPKSPNLNK